jgi:hypothetical protein
MLSINRCNRLCRARNILSMSRRLLDETIYCDKTSFTHHSTLNNSMLKVCPHSLYKKGTPVLVTAAERLFIILPAEGIRCLSTPA